MKCPNQAASIICWRSTPCTEVSISWSSVACVHHKMLMATVIFNSGSRIYAAASSLWLWSNGRMRTWNQTCSEEIMCYRSLSGRQKIQLLSTTRKRLIVCIFLVVFMLICTVFTWDFINVSYQRDCWHAPIRNILKADCLLFDDVLARVYVWNYFLRSWCIFTVWFVSNCWPGVFAKSLWI
jgi:hypothetical protein